MHPGIEIDSGHVYFSQNPYTATRENPESILHFFYTVGESGGIPDTVALAACETHAPLLAGIHRPVVAKHMRNLLALANIVPLIQLMHERKVLQYVLGFILTDLSLLLPLQEIEAMTNRASPWEVRLILLLLAVPMPPEKSLAHLTMFWEMLPKEVKTIERLLEYFPAAEPTMPEEKKQEICKEWGEDFMRSLFLLRWALEDDMAAAKMAYLAALQ
jgi:hypothetical protein